MNSVLFLFTPLTIDHIPLLRMWFNEPHVSQWWPTPEKEEDFFAHFLKRIRSSETQAYLAEYQGTPIGYIQTYPIDLSGDKTGKWLPELPAHTIGTDQFIGDPAYVGKGYGTHMLKEFILYVQQIRPEVTTIIVDPDPENKAAIRCYEKVGFVSVGTFDTPYGKALLMRYNLLRIP